MLTSRAFCKERVFSALAFLFSVVTLSVAALAQSVTLVPNAIRYVGNGTTGYAADNAAFLSVGLNQPQGLAIDALGNLILADSAHNCVRRADATAQQISTLVGLTGSGVDTCNTASNAMPSPTQGLLNPMGVAADATGRVFIADTGHNCVRGLSAGASGVAALTPVAGTCGASASASTTPVPVALTTDRANNLYIVVNDTVNNVYQVLRHNAGDAAGAVCRVAGAASAQGVAQCADVTGSVTLLRPSGVAVDPVGVLHIADTGDNCVVKLEGGAFSTSAGTCGSAASAVVAPASIAFSRAGTMYISLPGKNQVLRYNQASGALRVVAGNPNGAAGAYSLSQDGAAATAVPLNLPGGMVVDGNDNLYVSDAGNSIVRRLTNGVSFPNTFVGSLSQLQAVTFEIEQASNLSAVVGPDYTMVNGCTGNQIPAAAGQPPVYCKVTVQFKPTLPGNRYSPLTVTDSLSSTSVAAGLQGVGVGPLAQLFPGQADTLAGSLGQVIDVKHDSAGAVYALVTSGGQSQVVKIPAGGGSPVTVVAAGAGMKSPVALGVDAAGNIFVADTTGSSSAAPSVQRYGADGSVNLDYVTGITAPTALVADGYGNLTIAEAGSANDVLHVFVAGQRAVLAGGGTGSAADGVVATGVKLTSPSGVTLGADGTTVYFSDAGAHRVYSVDGAGILHVVAGNGGTTTTAPDSALGQALVQPTALDTDAAGDLYIVDSGANALYTYFAATDADNNLRLMLGNSDGSAGSSGYPGPAASAGLNNPSSVTVVPGGMIYVGDSGNGAIRRLDFPNTTLDFGDRAINTTATLTQTIWNNGNAQLQREMNPAATAPFGYDNVHTTCGPTVLQGVLCDLAFTYKPTVLSPPSDSQVVQVFDNAPTSPQELTLKGNGVLAKLTTFTPIPEVETYGGPYAGGVSLVGNGDTPTGTITFDINNGAKTCTLTGSFTGTVRCTLLSGTLLPVVGSPYPVTITYVSDKPTSDPGYYPSVTVNTTLTVVPRPLTETVNSKSRPYLQPNPVLDGNPNGVLPGVGSDSFTVTYGFGAVPITVNTAPGTYKGDIVATITPNGSTAASNYRITNTPGDFTITTASLGGGFTAPAETEVYGGLYTGTASYTTSGVAPTGTVTFSVNGKLLCSAPMTAATCSLPEGTGLQAGQYTVSVAYSGDSNYSAQTITTPLTVTPAPLTVTVADQTKVFGAPVPDLTGTATVTGLVNGDTVGTTIILTYSTTVTQTTPVGVYPNSITVVVSGSSSGSYTITNTPGTFTVGGIATAMTLTTSGSPAFEGSPVTFTAKIAAGTAVPTGTIQFSSDGTPIGSPVTVDATGTATVTTATLPVGTHTIRALYGGSGSYASSSAILSQVIAATVGNFTISASPDSQYIIGPGSKTWTVTVTSQNGFAGTVYLSCSGLPSDAGCTFNSAALALTSGGTATTTMTTTTTNADAVVAMLHGTPMQPGAPVLRERSGWPGGGALVTAAAVFPMQLGGLGMMMAGFRRRRRFAGRHWMLLALMTLGLLGLAGCGCPTTTYHTYPVVVSGTNTPGGASQASATVYLGVGAQQQ